MASMSREIIGELQIKLWWSKMEDKHTQDIGPGFVVKEYDQV